MVLAVYLLPLLFICTGMAARFVPRTCDRRMFDGNVASCLSQFNHTMETSGYRHRCPWPTVKRIYNKLKSCVDDWTDATSCKGHGFLVDGIFLDVHREYFSLCGQVHDPPPATLAMLITPVILATLVMPLLCVHLTTWNTDAC